MTAASNEIKKSANAQFAAADYSSAIDTYDKALAELPTYLDYELAVLQSNIAACHVKLEQWKEAIDACESGLAGLERELPTKSKSKSKSDAQQKPDFPFDNEDDPSSPPPAETNAPIIELPSNATDAELNTHLANLALSDTHITNIKRIRTKLLLRRARSKTSILPPTLQTLSDALSDYTTLSEPAYFTTLPLSDQRTVRMALASLPPRVNEAKDKEMKEMMGKLKDLGNGILKPFGLSTDMFKMVKDEGSGGWSMNFDQGGGGAGEGKKS